MKYRRYAHAFTQNYTVLRSRANTPHKKNTSPDTSEVPPIMTSEVKKNLKEMKNNKVLGIDNLTSDAMIHRGDESVKHITKKFNHILETKRYRFEWKEAKMIILQNKRDTKDIKITGYYKNDWKMLLMKTNQRTGWFQKGLLDS